MIKANELRIGNWIRYEGYGEFDFKVAHLTSEGASDHEDAIYFEANLEPISLTPEILEKAGFKIKSNAFGIWCDIEFNDYSNKPRSISLNQYGEYYYMGATRIRFVHQLQNLYFALTGEELSISL